MFCSRCGSQIEANTRFCGGCGAPAEAPAAPPAAPPPPVYAQQAPPPPVYAQQAPPPPVYAQQAPPPGAYMAPPPAAPAKRKGLSPLAWVGIVVLGVIVLGAVGVGVLTMVVVHKVKQAGFDPALIERHPELAIVKMAVAGNPDAEIVNIDEDRGIVSVRDKKTGKVVTMNFQDIKEGRFSLTDESGKTVSVEAHGQGETGSLDVKTDQGTAHIGAGALNLPGWLPAYPGSSPQGIASSEGAGASGAFSFRTTDSVDRVVSFYEDALKRGGFNVDVNRHAAGALISADNGSKKATINALNDGAGASATVTYEDK